MKPICIRAALVAVLFFPPSPTRSQAASAAPLLAVTVSSRPLDSRVAEQALSAYDAGDSYPTATGRRTLHRLAGAVGVRVSGDTEIAQTIQSLTKLCGG